MSDVRVGKGDVRKSFGRAQSALPVPDLIEVQSSSFNDFVQLDCLPEERRNVGLEKVLRDIFPIEHEDQLSLEYVSYELGHWACTCGKLKGLVSRYRWKCSACKQTGCSRLPDDLSCLSCGKKEAARYETCVSCLSRVAVRLPVTVEECRASGQTFTMPLKIKIQLIGWAVDEDGTKEIRDIKEQDIFFADMPVMVDLFEKENRFYLGDRGTFLINGVERVVVSQLHRSPGVVFSQSKKAKDYHGKPYYLARIIPMRGSWLDFEFDSSDLLHVRADKKKKFLVTTLLQALGYARDKIIPLFYDFDQITVERGTFYCAVDEGTIGRRIEKGMVPKDEEKSFLGRRVNADILAKLRKAGIKKLKLRSAGLIGSVLGRDVIDTDTGEVLIEQGETLDEGHIALLSGRPGLKFHLIRFPGYVLQPSIALTLAQDKCMTQDEALRELHGKIWPGESLSLKDVRERLDALFFSSRLYDLTRVGRVRMNMKLGLDVSEETCVLTKEDIIATVRYLVSLRERGEGELDDIDHLGNRRVRLVGELLNNQMYLGLTRVSRIVRERFRMQEAHGALMPQDFLNVKPVSVVLREFFGLGQLSQFADQTNPLAELAHKRRLSALGPGGVLKDRATFEVRDVHTSHYGRICPIETPEGQTVGLISSLATYAVVNDLGFIETAYNPVVNGKIMPEVVFLDAAQEAAEYIAQIDAIKPGTKTLKDDKVLVRYDGNFVQVDTDRVTYIDLSPKQLVSVSASLIPFLEHDDAVRVQMGANMQRQAVPLIRTSAPIVGTGMEREIARGSGAVLIARRPGTVEYVSSEKIIIRADRENFSCDDDWVTQGLDTYVLKKFERSSYSTWVHHTPIVRRGDRVQEGTILTNGAAVKDGELALGTNMMVAFMPWHGYNFEDAIVLNKRLVADDALTTVHIDEYSVDARDTKLGPEEITRDLPNVSDAALACLDDDGIVRVGTRVKPGDILVGKVTLKGDIQYSPEEKLLRAIFGEKSREVRNTSLIVPPGVEGSVIDVKIFSRSGVRKDERYKQEVAREIAKSDAAHEQHVGLLEGMLAERIVDLLDRHEPSNAAARKFLNRGKVSKEALMAAPFSQIIGCSVKDKKVMAEVKQLVHLYENQVRVLEGLKEGHVSKLKKGDPLPSGVIKMVKVYVAMKRPISVGDKIAGRHGNKGVVSNIVPREDMPYLDDGTSIDVVLSPLGVPSRMNVGQILETALGFVGKKMGEQIQQLLETDGYASVKAGMEKFYGKSMITAYEKDYGRDGVKELARRTADTGVRFSSPVFDGADFERDIAPLMEKTGLPTSGNVMLRDGRTGECFDQPVTVGSIYIMKLNHMVDDKLHARSVGPYSLVTQQPLGGKAQQGGQRLGEMEVWALEAYGAAYTLQEMLTCKSDDVGGRHKAYEAVVRGEDVPEPGVPESFNVLIKELQSLGLQVDLLKVSKEDIGE